MKTHGSGAFKISDLLHIGDNVIIEDGVRIFHPEKIQIGDNVYIGHDTILHGYYNSNLIIESNTWIGPQCYFHSAGGLLIQKNVGIGPSVKILTSYHNINDNNQPIKLQSLIFKSIILSCGCDIGMSSVILPGVTIGKGVQVGAGSVVNKDVLDYLIVAGNPAKCIGKR